MLKVIIPKYNKVKTYWKFLKSKKKFYRSQYVQLFFFFFALIEGLGVLLTRI